MSLSFVEVPSGSAERCRPPAHLWEDGHKQQELRTKECAVVQRDHGKSVRENQQIDGDVVPPVTDARDWVAILRPTLPTLRGWVREIFGLLLVIHSRRAPAGAGEAASRADHPVDVTRRGEVLEALGAANRQSDTD